MRALFHDGLFALSLVVATGMVMLSFSLIDVISASPPLRVTRDAGLKLAFGQHHHHAHRHADRDTELASQIPPH